MLIDCSHRRWIIVTVALLAVATIAYIAYVRSAPGGPQGGNVPGMLFGLVGSGLMIYASLLWVRKKLPRWQIGSAQTWLRGHIWLGSLSVPIILFHAGFQLGGGLERALWAVLAAIVLSGVFGLALQQFLPRDLTSRVPLETFYEQVPHVCQTLQLEADVLVAGLCGPLVIEPLPVADEQSLSRLGVTGRDPLRKVYLVHDESDNKSSRPKHGAGKPAAVEKAPALQPTDQPETTQPTTAQPTAATSAADKIAAMRAAKKVTPAAAGAAQGEAPPQTADVGGGSDSPAQKTPTKALSAADKIAAMRAMKSGAASTSTTVASDVATAKPAETPTTEPAPQEKLAAKTMSAADKIAAMRAMKAGAASTKTPAPQQDSPSRACLSTADKIAAMKAGKAAGASPPSAVAEGAASAEAKPTVAKTSSAADKIALMRAAKAVSTTASPDPAVPAPSTAKASAVQVPGPQSAKAKTAIVRQPRVSDDWKSACPDLLKFYLGEVRPFLDQRYRRRNPLSAASSGNRLIATVKLTLPAEMHAALARMSELCEERRQLATQVRMHRWLHAWQLVHVPLTVALLVLGAVHAAMSVYY